MKEKLILIIIDGLNYDVSKEMGYMKALEEAGKANFYKIKAELPTLSRPLYETILTGITPIEHGIVNNQINRLSKEENIFSIAKKKDLRTGAASYYWMSELYNSTPFDRNNDMYTEDTGKNIQYGRFYCEDNYPDSHLFVDGEWIRKKYDPHFLLIHSMNVDDCGHKHGEDSLKYRNSARNIDRILGEWLPLWVNKSYQIIVTADHGMNIDKTHGSNSKKEREIPLWLIGDRLNLIEGSEVSQLHIAPIICNILGIKQSTKMLEIKKI
ncbi:MAG: alkaline phosphatase family protein [Psychrilyobacter sp.]|uniref:alkaline phosphatase family protein n=1 Tax=Psychrilyobacter sp. TaxID=2586924 RepID=UPI003C744A7E